MQYAAYKKGRHFYIMWHAILYLLASASQHHLLSY